MQDIFDNFCMGKLIVARDKRYKSPDQGGLGLVNLKEFLIAQHVIWFKRAFNSTRDNWRVDLWELGYGNPFTINPATIDRREHPILAGLAESFSKFLECFTLRNENYLDSYIFNNPCFKRSNRDDGILDTNFFKTGGSPNFYKISQLTYRQCFANGVFRDLNFFNNDLQLGISLVTYFRLRLALSHFKNNREIDLGGDNSSVSVSRFFCSFKKGSKSCRRFLTPANKTDLREINTVVTFFFLIDLEVPDRDSIKFSLGLWNIFSLPNGFKEFIFKFFYNKLGLNTRVSHFAKKERQCTFCALLDKNTTSEEDFCHLFYSCPNVYRILVQIENTMLMDDTYTISDRKYRWFGINRDNTKNKFKTLFYLGLQYHLWGCKLRKTLPNADFLVGETIIMLEKSCRLDNTLNNSKTNFNCNLSRYWDVLREPRW